MGQLANVVEWNEFRDDVIFWKWANKEIKKSSRLIIRPGQDAIFLYNGRIEGIFTDEGNFEIESQIIPFLSSLKGFKFGFNSGLRAEVVFINTKQFTVKWGTKGAVLVPAPNMPGGLPIRAFGTFQIRISDSLALIDRVAGIKTQFTLEDVRDRVTAELDGLLMRWIAREGRDIFNLQANSQEIARGIQSDLDMSLTKIGLSVVGFSISNFNYPEEIQKRITQNASQQMIGDVDRYQRVAMTDAMANGKGGGSMSDTAGSMAGMMMGMQMANQMIGNMQSPPQNPSPAQTSAPSGSVPKFCPECGFKLSPAPKFCPECGNKLA